MALILHVIQALSLGGAARALVATSKASSRHGAYQHRVISLLRPAPEAVKLAEEAGLTVLSAPDPATLQAELAAADIVQLHWWNNPQNQQFLRMDWPATRLLLWYHVAGDNAPQLITPELVDFADLNVPTNPWSYRELPVLRDLPAAERERRVATVLDAADLDRVAGAALKPHQFFNVGYIGAVDFVKMHRRFVPMSAAVRVPDARFIVCGKGVEDELKAEARALGAAERFEFRGYVQDIRPVIETFDVYGYPLCPDSYASGELNLQEVMAVGVPPVVFPAGGIKGLVEHERTGLVVSTEAEYTQAIEHLFHHPEARRRLGLAAREHALAHFGADNAARDLNPLYERLLREPKRARRWGVPAARSLLAQPISLLDVLDSPANAAGARLFAESLGSAGDDFVTSLTSTNPEALFDAERRIACVPELVRSLGAGGFRQYRRNYPQDPYLQLWHALALDQEGKPAEAAVEFGRTIEQGCTHWRVGWYVAQAARRAGDESLASEAARSVLAVAPNFVPARQFLEGVKAAEPQSHLQSNGHGHASIVERPERNEPNRSKPVVNEAFLASQREFWNVDTLDEAMFGRVFTSAEITKMTPAERQAAWEHSAISSMNQVLAGVPHQPDWRVLEIGCGVGRVIKPLRERFARVDGVDISETMVAYAREYLRAARGQGDVILNSGADLAGLPDDAYDLVYSIIVFQHIRSVSVVRSYLRETRRVLKPGGYFRLQVYELAGRQGTFDEEARPGVQYGFNGNGYTPDQLRALLEEAGFTLAAIETAGRWIWATARAGDRSQESGFGSQESGVRSQGANRVADELLSRARQISAGADVDVNGPEEAPLISAIVSTYNSEQFIRGCLEDLERQTIADRLEIIVIDSGSPQNERAVVAEFQRRYSNIRYVRTEREPLYTAWNRGVRLARGKYLTNANTDDRHEPRALERHVQALEQNPDAILAYADVAFCENVHPDFGPAQLRGHYRWPDFDRGLLFANCYIGPQPVWRRDAHERYGFFDESYKSAGDYEFWLRLAVHERFVHLSEVLGLYWYSAKSVGHDNMDLTRDEAERARRTHWHGVWGSWPKLTRALLKPLKADQSSEPPPTDRQTRSTPRPNDRPKPSPFQIDFANFAANRTNSASLAATPAPNLPAADPSVVALGEEIIGRAHRDRIVSLIPSHGRVLIWGLDGAVKTLATALPSTARRTWITHCHSSHGRIAPDLQRSGIECRLHSFTPGDNAAEAAYVAGADGPFDVIVVAGELRPRCLLRALELLSPQGTVFLHDAQRPEFDLVKRGAVEFGHMGPCPEAPGPHLWWGGVNLQPVMARATASGPAPVVVNFYTANTPYEEEAKRLLASCQALGVECHAESVPTHGDWVVNCAFKARFILQIWERLRRPVLWLDADAVLRARPELLTGATCDFAVHKVDGWQFASGTIYFNQTPMAERLLRRWVERSTADPSTWDQVSLDLAWEDVARTLPLETLWLPDIYTKIFDRASRFSASAIVAEHFQASRRLKKIVSENQADTRPKYAPDLVAARRASRPTRDRLAAEEPRGSTPELFVGPTQGAARAAEEALGAKLLSIASRAAQAEQSTKATALLWNAAACTPTSPDAWSALARLYIASGELESAENVLAQARRSVPAGQHPELPVLPWATAAEATAPEASPDTSQPKSTEDLLSSLRGRRIAIVGNGTPAHDFGDDIDRYDVVIRLNNFRTTGFEAKIGRKTTCRCTSGWRDIEHRHEHLEFSPFAAHLPESANLAAYNAANARPLLTPRTNIHELLPAVAKPSTGCALVALCSKLGLTVDLFAFDGFKTSHYWSPGQAVHTTHHGDELNHLLRLPGVTLHSTPMSLPNPDRANPGNPSNPRPDDFCLPTGYQSRLQPEYYEDSVTHATGIVWQPDVYPIVARLARRLECFHILDLGCGSGDKLAELHPAFMITGVDFGANLKRCRDQYAFGQWLEADFETVEHLPLPAQVLARSAVVCSDVIEHLINPTALLRLIGRLLEQVPVVVLSTPERSRARGPGDMGPPKNKAHVREWTLDELEALLRRHQLPVEFIGFTRSNTQTGVLNTQIAILTRTTSGPSLLPNAKRGDPIGIVNDQMAVLPDIDMADSSTTSCVRGQESGVRGQAGGQGAGGDDPLGVAISTPAIPAPGPDAVSGDAALDAAEAQAREALRLKPNGLEALRLLVAIGLQRGRWQETGRLCVQILQQAPADIETLLSLAKCFFRSDDRDTTRVVLERILELDPQNPLARENLATLNGALASAEALKGCLQRAQQALNERELPVARTALEQAVALVPHDADLFVALGNVQAEIGEVDAARTSYARALSIEPRHPLASERIVELTIESSPGPLRPNRPSRPTSPTATDTKETHELAYWKARKQEEGTLANAHYRSFYTTHFGLPYEFYAGKRILDIGCGPRGSLEWADHALERVGLDPLADRYRELGADAHKMRYAAAGSESIPFPDDHFDVVTSFNSLDHVENLDRSIDEIMRVVKPGGLFLLLTDVNHSPTPCEPIEFSWDILERFKARFEVVEERHFEKVPKAGIYRSIEEALPYDQANTTRRYGILLAKLRKLPVATPGLLPASDSDVGTAVSSEGNTQAFDHLQRAFDLLKERRFIEAQTECARYREQIRYEALPRADRRPESAPEVSIVIVAYRIGRGLLECLDSLAASPAPPHEIIVVDNGGNEDIASELARRPILHVRMPMNVILSEGRNVGVSFARGPVVAFVDDDSLAAPGYLEGVAAAFRAFDIDGYRGKVLPKTEHANNRLARHYNMGDLAFPADVDTEGNSAFATAVYRELHGMDPLLFGMEGTELSYRIAARRGEYRTIYWPGAIIRHDYAGTDDKLGQKNSRHQLMRDYAVSKHPGLMKHHGALIAFNQSDAARRTGHGLIRRRAGSSTKEPAAACGQTGLTQPFFSICIPTYNRARFIRESIESALKQTYPKFEVVIVDDGSTDETTTIVRQYRTDKLRYIRKEHSGGPATRNRCIAEARGEFLVWVDSDDAILPRTLEAYAAALEGYPEVDALYGDLRIINEQSIGEMIWSYRDYHGWPDALMGDLLFENKIPNVCTLVRKTAYARIGGYSEEFPRAHDYEFWTRLAADGSVHRVNEVVGLYRQHGSSLSQHQGNADTSYEARAVQSMIERHGLRRLLPACFAPGVPEARSMAHAWLIAAVVMYKYGQTSAAKQYLERSVAAADVPANRIIARLISATGTAPSSSNGATRRQTANTDPDHFPSVVESTIRAFQSGQAGKCAQLCTRLTELQPEGVETLFLVAMSLSRWGDPRMGRTAFGCLANRLSEAAYIEAADATQPDASDMGPIEASPATDALRPLAVAAAQVLEVTVIPISAVQMALQFIEQCATAADPQKFASLNRRELAPVCSVILGLRDEELRAIGGERLAGQVQKARGSLVRPLSAGTSRRPSGWSFCIITNGRRPEKLRRQVDSIRALKIPAMEILVGGEVPPGFDDVTVVSMPGAAARGRLAEMRNNLAARARYDRLVVSDDDMLFRPDFYEGLQRMGDDFEVMSVRMLNPDGSRFWDWVSVGGPRGQVLLDYWEIDPDTYVTGGLCVLRAAVLDRVKWDENRGFYEAEDVDFSRRLQAAGISIRFNPFCGVTHDDDRYTRVGRKVMRFDHILNAATQSLAAGEREPALRYFDAAIRVAGTDPQRREELRVVAARLGEEARLAQLPATAPPVRTEEGSAGPIGPIRFRWEGSFLDLGSLSHVNRELTSALARQAGIELSCQAGSMAAIAQPELQALERRLSAQPAQITVRHAWPPDWRRPREGAWVLIQPWEFGALPQEWVRELRRVDEVWVPSQYVRRVYLESGVDADKVHVVPNGIDPARFHPGAPALALATRKKFKFLFVGGTIHRKGPDVLLKAYLDRFTAADDVCLVIKDFGGQSVYAGQTFEQQIAAAQAKPNAPEILYLTQELAPAEMSGLYTACDCLVHPYRGEGFGLPVLEAMACGRPVVVTAGGSTEDFVTDECGWRIPAVRRQFGDTVSGMKLVKPGWFLEPDAQVLAEQMDWIASHPTEARAKGEAASRHVHAGWTWDHAARIALERARGLGKRAEQEHRPKKTIELPACARVGHLADARAALGRKQWIEAWNATIAALLRRPYHPEAWLTLAEIAQLTGDAMQAKLLADRARQMAPKWKPAQQLARKAGQTTKGKGPAKVALPALPDELRAQPGAGRGSETSQPRLSVCLIVRNEEQFLDRCLESVRGLAHQIVVVDTGSTDATCTIARRHQAEVHTFEWRDDFSAARNAALEVATGDWILFLDADEELVPADREKLQQLLTRPTAIAYRLPILDHGREEEGVNYVPRLYRNAPGLFYVGRVHEQVFSSLEVRRTEWGLENVLGDATLLHHGYTKEILASRDKIGRNLRLLEQAIEELPDEPNLLMNLGLELVRAGRLTEGLERYQEAFEAMATLPKEHLSPELREALLTQYGTHLLSAKNYAEIARLYQSPLAKAHGLTASMHWVLGLACIESKLYSEGADQMRHCLAKRGKRALTLVNRNILKGGPHHCLALCLAAMKRNDEAARAFESALKEEPAARNVRFDYARFLGANGQEIEALKWIHQLMADDPADVRIWRLGGDVALQKPEFLEFALDWTSEAVKAHPHNTAILEQRATALLLAGQSEEARPMWGQLAETGSPTAWAALLTCETVANRQPSSCPPPIREKVDQEFLRWYRRLLKWNASGIVNDLNRRMDILRQFAPRTTQMLETALAEAAT